MQVLDLPGIIEGAKDGKGRGKQIISVAMTCSLILVILDSSKPWTIRTKIEKELFGFGMRLNKSRPNIFIEKGDKGRRRWEGSTAGGLFVVSREDGGANCFCWGGHHHDECQKTFIIRFIVVNFLVHCPRSSVVLETLCWL